jgi:penicillin amidase
MPGVLRWVARLALVAAVVLVLLGAAAIWRLWRAMPETTGVVLVAGLERAVDVVRDPDGVPHIRAASERDGMRALGYVHAQDRLWQMEFQRRLASGRLAELLGPTALRTDRFMRTVGFARSARDALLTLDPETRSLLEAYVGGVNEHLRAHQGTRLPVEFALVKHVPEPWRPEDVLAWQKVMGWSMSLNWREEVLSMRLVSRVGETGATALLPASGEGDPLVLPDLVVRPSTRVAPTRRKPPRAPAAIPSAIASLAQIDPFRTAGSNNWVISGSRTATGRPLLANDPHLATQAPGAWYVAHITAGALDVIGATLPGTPAVVIGHNRRIAWGVTNMMSDVQDLFAERINERDEAEVDGRWEPMRILHETIAVRDAPPVTLRVRITRHGPLISDLVDERTPLALRWTGHEPLDGTVRSIFRLNTARSWDEFVSAFAGYQVPALNFVYADVDGNIGYIGPGAVPVRAGDGRAPLAGWVSANDWRGYVPAADLPRALNPARGFIASANNKVVPDTYPYLLSTSWDAPYRAARIVEELQKLPRATVADLQRLQNDQRSAQVSRVLPWLLTAVPTSDRSREAIARLRGWNGSLDGWSEEAALYKAYAAVATARLFEDELGPELWEDYRGFTGAAAKALDRIAAGGDGRWCDDVTTRPVETCAAMLGQALEQALDQMSEVQGTEDLSRWRWAHANPVWFPHLPFHASTMLRPIFSRRAERGGDAFTVNPTMPLHDQVLVASYRQILDLGNFDRSVFVLPLGQSGHLLSRGYAGMLDDWNEGRYRPLRFSAAAVDAAATSRLRLEPLEN